STLRLVPAPSSAIAPSEQDPEDLAVLLGLRAVRLAGGDVDDLARPDLPGHPAGVQRGRALEEDRHLVLRVHRLALGRHALALCEARGADAQPRDLLGRQVEELQDLARV